MWKTAYKWTRILVMVWAGGLVYCQILVIQDVRDELQWAQDDLDYAVKIAKDVCGGGTYDHQH